MLSSSFFFMILSPKKIAYDVLSVLYVFPPLRLCVSATTRVSANNSQSLFADARGRDAASRRRPAPTCPSLSQSHDCRSLRNNAAKTSGLRSVQASIRPRESARAARDPHYVSRDSVGRLE